jgi:hypothetical protein
LLRLTRAELFDLHREIAAALAGLPETSTQRLIALDNLRNIGCALARPHLSPC